MVAGKLKDWLPRSKMRGTPSATPLLVPSGKLWPTGEFSYGYARTRPDGGDWHEDPFVGLGVDDVAMASRPPAHEQMRSRQLDADLHALEVGCFSFGPQAPSERVAAPSGGGPEGQPLNLSDTANSHSRPKRGLKGITSYGRHMVKSFGALVNRDFPRHRTTLGTVTLPVLPERERCLVVQRWGELARRLLQWLSRKLERQGVPSIVCSVTEVQPRRLRDSGQGYLHFHVLWLNRPAKSGSWSVDPNELREWFSATLARLLDVKAVGHVNVNVKRVKGNAASYMAKYMSKGSADLAEAQEDWGEDVTPSTWWNMTKSARDWVKSNVHEGRDVGEVLERVVDKSFASGNLDDLPFVRQIEIEIDGALLTVGWMGRFSPRLHGHVLRVIESLSRE